MAFAETNHELGTLDKNKMEVIVEVCGEILDGKLHGSFSLICMANRLWNTV